jgi:Asp-tRNA(Asn)/Glu-tRNA(Gln) amidotransferase A subunit family amidase
MTFGAIPYSDNVPDHDPVAVARLRAAGAILIGKTTTAEFGTKCMTVSPLFGRTRNARSGERSRAAPVVARRWRSQAASRLLRLLRMAAGLRASRLHAMVLSG